MLFDVNLEEAREDLLNFITPLAGESVPLARALGRFAARDFIAPLDLPPYPQSAVDGYAVHESDLNKQKMLSVRDKPLGREIQSWILNPGQADKVLTGGPLPGGTGAVIPQEFVTIEGDKLILTGEIIAGSNIKQPGEDFRAGDPVMRRGTRIDPGLVGVLAALGQCEVVVYRRPRVMILSLGSEIVPCHTIPAPGQIRDSNGPLLAALATSGGGQVGGVEIACYESTAGARDMLKRQLKQADLVLTIGRTASGANDYALALLREIGARVLFWGVKIKPGSHSGAALWESKPVISLSGNPAACAVGYQLLAAPVLRALQGLDPYPYVISALCNDSFPKKGGPRRFLRGYTFCGHDGWKVSLLPGQKSSMLRSLMKCNSLIDLPAGHNPLEPGAEVSVILLSGESFR